MKAYYHQVQGFRNYLENRSYHLTIQGQTRFELVLLSWDGVKQIVSFATLSTPSSKYQKEDYMLSVQISRIPVAQKYTTDHMVSTISNK